MGEEAYNKKLNRVELEDPSITVGEGKVIFYLRRCQCKMCFLILDAPLAAHRKHIRRPMPNG